MLSTLQPQQSSLNKPVYGVVSTQRSRQQNVYGNDELAALTSAGIDVICNPIVRGPVFGVRLGVNASANPSIQDDSWPRLTSWLARSLIGANALGPFIGEEITPQFFNDGYAILDAWLSGLTSPNNPNPVIQGYNIAFSTTNNPQSQTAKGIVVAAILIQFFGIARIFLVNMQTGATVILPTTATTAAAAAASALAAA